LRHLLSVYTSQSYGSDQLGVLRAVVPSPTSPPGRWTLPVTGRWLESAQLRHLWLSLGRAEACAIPAAPRTPTTADLRSPATTA